MGIEPTSLSPCRRCGRRTAATAEQDPLRIVRQISNGAAGSFNLARGGRRHPIDADRDLLRSLVQILDQGACGCRRLLRIAHSLFRIAHNGIDVI